MRQDLDRQKQQMMERLAFAEDQMRAKLDALSRAVDDRINQEFKKENIHNLVEDKAKSRIDEIADPLIQGHITIL
jgi:hypothetical protein